MSNNSIWSIDRTLSSTTIRDQSWPGSDDNEGVSHILQNSSITGASPSDCHIQDTLWGSLISLQRSGRVFCNPSRLGRSLRWGATPLLRCSRCILQPQVKHECQIFFLLILDFTNKNIQILFFSFIIIIIIIIRSYWQHRFLWLSFADRPYHPSLQVGHPDCIQCPYRDVICQPLLVSQH